jgi:hypothetical protein
VAQVQDAVHDGGDDDEPDGHGSPPLVVVAGGPPQDLGGRLGSVPVVVRVLVELARHRLADRWPLRAGQLVHDRLGQPASR